MSKEINDLSSGGIFQRTANFEAQRAAGGTGSSVRWNFNDAFGSLVASDIPLNDAGWSSLSGNDPQDVFDNLDIFLASFTGGDIESVLTAGNNANGLGIQELLGITNVSNDFELIAPNGVDLYLGTSPNAVNGVDLTANEIAIYSPVGIVAGDFGSVAPGLTWDFSADQLFLATNGGSSIFLEDDHIVVSTPATIQFNAALFDSVSISTGAAAGDTYSASGVIDGQIGPVGNITTGEDTLFTKTVSANSLAVNGNSLFITCSGTFANTANSKRLRIKFGGTTIFDSGALAITTASDWKLTCEIFRSGASAQKCISTLATSSSVLISTTQYATASVSFGSNQIVLITGEATATDDIVAQLFKLRFEP